MRLSFVIPAYLPALAYGGPATCTALLAEGLARRGCTVQVLTSDLGPGLGERLPVARERIGGVEVRRFSTPIRYRWSGLSASFLRQAGAALRDSDIVQIVGYRDGFGPLAARAARRQGTPVVWAPKGMVRNVGRSRLKKALFDLLVGSRQLARAHRVVPASRIEARECREAGVSPDRLELIPEPLPPAPAPSSEDVSEHLARHGLEAGGAWILYLGRLNYRKGLTFLADAVSRARTKTGIDLRLVLAGPVEDESLLESIRASLPAGALHLTGIVRGTEKWSLLAGARAFALASPFAENFGMAAGEALSMGTPVLLSPACGIGDHVDETAGRVLELEPGLWAGILADLARGDLAFDRDLVREAVAPLQVERIVERYARLYDEVAGAAC